MAERTCSKAVAGGPSKVMDCGMGQAVRQLADPEAPHSHTDKPGRTEGEQNRGSTQGSSAGKESLKPLIENTSEG